MMGRNFGTRPSKLWGIDEIKAREVAVEFNRICSLRLLLFDSEVKRREAEALNSDTTYGSNAPPQFQLSQNN